MRPERAVIDVSSLPDLTFGRRTLTWWATAGFILVEGTTFVILLVAYLYLRMNSAEWPPRPISNPDLLLPSVNMLLIVSACVPARLASKAARRQDRDAVFLWVSVMAAFAVASCALRWFEFGSLNVRWDVNAYGSAVWGVYMSHTLLLVSDALENVVMAVFLAIHITHKRHYTDIDDSADYQYFLAVVSIVMWLVVIMGPRLL